MQNLTRPPGSQKKTQDGHGSIPNVYKVVDLDTRGRDLSSFTTWRERLHQTAAYIHILSTILVSYVIFLRYSFTREEQRESGFAWLPWIVFVAELCSMATKYTDNLWRLSVMQPFQERHQRLRLMGADVPAVDVIITACGEDPSIVLDTARAACVLDYPTDRFRVIVSDDASDAQVETQIRKLLVKHPQLHYFARAHDKSGKHHGFKAGNINEALRFTSTLAGGPGEFFAVLDVDMIPEPALLRALLAKVVNDPRMAMAASAQYFYNLPRNDPLLQSHTVGNKIDEVIRDAAGATWCSGTGFIARSEAIAEIGGFSETTLAEDILCSLMLYGKGWKVAYVQEILQWGLVPPDFASHVKQRTKWHVGAMQNSLRLRFCLGASITQHMTLHQRLSGVAYCFNTWTSSILRLPALCLFPYCLLLNKDLVSVGSQSQLQYLLRISLASTVIGRLNELLSSIPTGYKLLRNHENGQFWMTPLLVYQMIRELLPIRCGGQRMGFMPSGSVKSALNERSVDQRAPLENRLMTIISEYGIGFNVCVLVGTTWAVITSVVTATTVGNTPSEIWRTMILRVLWPGIPWQQYVAMLSPLTYMIWPPTVPERRQLMEQDAETKVWRPRTCERGEHYDKWVWTTMIVPTLSLIVHVAACVHV